MMKNSLLTLGVTVAVALNMTPAQASSLYSFSQVFDGGEVLSGTFSGTDTNSNNQIDFAEFTSFTSTFTSTETGFENLSWGLSNLASSSYFASGTDYSFLLTNPGPTGNDTGWNSNGQLGNTFVGNAFIQDGPIAAVFSASEPLTIQSVPESSPVLGLVVVGLGAVLGLVKPKS